MTLKELKTETENDYMGTVADLRKSIENYQGSMEEIYRNHYLEVCQTLALIYMKEHGYNNIPDIGYIFGFHYDEIAEEYIVDERMG